MRKKVVIILGPTATGKTKLAVKLARKFKGEIVSADSRQVYKGMDIGTGKDLEEYGRVPYHLIDVASPKSTYTLDRWLKDAKKSINDILQRGKLPIVAGGTGLYISALVEGYDLPKVKNNSIEIRSKLDKLSLNQLLSRLKKIDPETFEIIDKKNRRRVQRALEIYYQTGQVKSAQIKKKSPDYDFLLLGITFPKQDLQKKTLQRLEVRFDKQDMIGEVFRLHKKGVSWQKLDNFGLEYRWIARYLQNKITYEEMFKELSRATFNFAKRQMTWFKRNKKIKWIKASEAEKLVKNFLK